MRISNTFNVPLPPDEAWNWLMDIPSIVPCMPGAELTAKVHDNTYKGKVSVKLGPVALSFNGVATFEKRDEAARTATVKAQGTDAKGRGGANAVVTFSLEPIPTGIEDRHHHQCRSFRLDCAIWPRRRHDPECRQSVDFAIRQIA